MRSLTLLVSLPLIAASLASVLAQTTPSLIAPARKACQSDTDCAAGEPCLSSFCRPKCTRITDCQASETCLGVCRPLCNDADPKDKTCDVREKCMNSICRPKCINGRACPDGFGCWNGACVQYCFKDESCSREIDDECTADFESTKVKGDMCIRF